MSRLQSYLEEFVTKIVQEGLACHDRRIIVGFSGGLDSMVLLHLLSQCLQNHSTLPLMAVHVNHGLQSQADEWEQFCLRQGELYGVKTVVMRASVDLDAGEGLEQAARQARYQAFAEILQKGDLLCLAHHQDDQAETVLYRLLRGSGPLGLSAMASRKPFSGAEIVRPLLSCSKDELEEYAHLHQLSWVDDPSNTDIQFDRNYLRSEIMPRLKQRWPAVNKTFSRAAELNQETVLLLDDVAKSDLASVACENGQGLNRQQLMTMSPLRINNLLRYWLRQCEHLLPSRAVLLRIRHELLASQASGMAVVEWTGAEVRVFEDRLYCMPNLASVPAAGRTEVWSSLSPYKIDLGAEAGVLQVSTTQGEGIKAHLFEQALEQGSLMIKWREGGERCQPEGRDHSQKLKKLLQEYHVPPWQRDRLPLVYIGDELAAVPGFWVCKGFAASAMEKACLVKWHRP
ncbi:MAG: tRNA lysidine(34) synthetase TilS [Pseudomonadales bacterium]|nr:tRNA lysidine(34) synthetase TilS [Pseudomonadales bacterium]